MTKVTRKSKSVNLTESERKVVARKIVRARDAKSPQSWAKLAERFDMSPKSVRRLYDEAKGAGAHYESRPLVGGRPAPVQEQEEASK